ncbi:MAG TPA: aminoglycoside phosphotransferase family protein [Acidimicrobiia bacterium]
MEPLELADRLAGGGRVQELTSIDRVLGVNRIYRLWTDQESRIVKIYGTPARERRERHALDALGHLDGMPTVLDRGAEGDLQWVIFEDAGRWNIGSLPENIGIARRAGEILARIHESESAPLSNLSRGIDQEWVTVDFMSTFRRLERYRGKIGITMDLIEQARRVRPPYASEPRVAHTNAVPENFLVDDDGNVTLINWEWATLAPPEWDLSKAMWLSGLKSGQTASRGLQEGYGRALEPEQLDRWTVYHAGMMLVFEAENTMRTDLDEFDYLLAELQRAVTAAASAD